MTTFLIATREHHQHRKSGMLHLHSWNKSMGIGVRAVIKKFEKYVGYIDTARISETKANTRNYKWYYKMKPANN